jgi:hypothetical protein
MEQISPNFGSSLDTLKKAVNVNYLIDDPFHITK